MAGRFSVNVNQSLYYRRSRSIWKNNNTLKKKQAVCLPTSLAYVAFMAKNKNEVDKEKKI